MDIRSLHKDIARTTGRSRNTVRKVLRESPAGFRKPDRHSQLDPYKQYLRERWEGSGLSAVRLFPEIQAMGFNGSVVPPFPAKRVPTASESGVSARPNPAFPILIHVGGRSTQSLLTGSSRPLRLERMEIRVTPTPEQEAFIRDGISTGRFYDAEDAARVALEHWEAYERRRKELLVNIEAGEASLARGEGIVLETPDDVARFFEELNRGNRTAPTVRVGSPRLTHAADSAAFEKQVIQEMLDTGLPGT